MTRPKSSCAFPYCRRASKGYGLCGGHYSQAARGEERLTPLRKRRDTSPRYRPPEAKCRACGRMTCAAFSNEDGIHRRCACGKTSIYRSGRDRRLVFVRFALTAEERRKYPTDDCQFPGCDRKRVQGYAWCFGHKKQKDRHGLAGMHPLWDRSSPEYRAHVSRMVRARAAERATSQPADPPPRRA